MPNHYPFVLRPLPYPTNALEPFIDEETMYLHHSKHQQKYVDNLNKTLEPYPQYHKWTLEKLVRDYKSLPSKIQEDVKNNAGGVFNHNLYFYFMGINSNKPNGMLLNAIDKQFGSFENFKAEFKEKALSVFGSGYTWLVTNRAGKLTIENTPNQDTVLPQGLYPILGVDVWEHAYYLKYQNRRNEYVDAWFDVIDWSKVQESYEMITTYYKRKYKK